MPHEVSTRALLAAVLKDGKTLGLPVCDADTRMMTFYRLDSPAELTAGAYGIPVPPQQESRILTPDAETVVLVPMLAFDREGYRLGAGGGYYDRFLAQYPGLPAVGICYAQCRVDALPRDRYDRRLTHCITQHNTEEYNGKA
jgi:5-formyltetrahydrofolate cyclo-ligase